MGGAELSRHCSTEIQTRGWGGKAREGGSFKIMRREWEEEEGGVEEVWWWGDETTGGERGCGLCQGIERLRVEEGRGSGGGARRE